MRSGVELTQSYVTPKCSPSRAALMTGRYPWRLGMQRGAVERYQPDGLNASIKLLPEYLKKAGYNTHVVRHLQNDPLYLYNYIGWKMASWLLPS